jgi:hypothetical protein
MHHALVMSNSLRVATKQPTNTTDKGRLLAIFTESMAQPLSFNLLGLAKELRQHIYRFCVAQEHSSQVVRNQIRPLEPAITQTSHLIRSESIPIYYEAYPFTVRTIIKCNFQGNVWLTTDKWYYNLDPNKLASVRNITIQFVFVERYFGEPVTVEFNILLYQKGRSYEFGIRHSFGLNWYRSANRKGDPADCEEVWQALYKHLGDLLTASLEEPGPGKFTVQEIDRLVQFEPDILPY